MAAPQRSKAAGEQLRKQSSEYAAAFAKPTAVAEASPALYGVMGQAQAQSLTSGASSQDNLTRYVEGPWDDIALRRGAKDEAERYDAALKNAQAAQLLLQQDANRAGMAKVVAEGEPDRKFLGGVEGVDSGYNIIYKPEALTRENTNTQRTLDTDNTAAQATATETLHKAGYDVAPEVVTERTTPLDAPIGSEPTYNVFKNPGGQIQNADEAEKVRHNKEDEKNQATTAAASMYRAQHGQSEGGTMTITLPGGLDPNTGEPLPTKSWRGKGTPPANFGGTPPTAQAPTPSPLGGAIMRAVQKGYAVSPSGANTVITNPATGNKIILDANGNQVH